MSSVVWGISAAAGGAMQKEVQELKEISKIINIPSEIKENLEKELEKREVCVKEQKLIEEVRTFFDTLYIKYLELKILK